MEAGGIPLTRDKCQILVDNKPCGAAPLSHNMPFCKAHKRAHTKKAPMSGWEPFYAPSLYNGVKVMKRNHNCFSYAFDIFDPPDQSTCNKDKDGVCNVGTHQPGYYSGMGKFSENGTKYCPDLLGRLLGDMPWLRQTTFEKKCPVGYSKIALVIDPKQDYHFYRQDSNGLWSHKPGQTAVTNRDAHGYLIYRPDLANRDARTSATDKDGLNYNIFCSYLCVPRNKPVLAQRGGRLSKSTHKVSKSRRRSTHKVSKKSRRHTRKSLKVL